MARSEELAWAAGFFDGEGCFSTTCPTYIVRDGSRINRRYLRLSVDQKYPELLEKFREIVGQGKVYHYQKAAGGSGFKFQASGRFAFRVACALWPYIGEQKKADFKRSLSLVKESRGGERHR